eukprot:TRINITY_DN9754_c0_g1_i1.p2 TRINITY_DN9754_c0_g1~~TRINITY_DN9754_c0_g1_i1.p2  ORF type:complete len:384 (+),score=47.99 TRINITY_DN9754_c0_g1_i1:637-1788(+)
MVPSDSMNGGGQLQELSQGAKVFVGGLSWETTDDRLRLYFQNFGNVRDAVVIKDKATGRPRGFGFVIFDDATIAAKVVSLHKHTIDRREVETRLAIPKEAMAIQARGAGSGLSGNLQSSAQDRKIFVGGLAPTVSERVFREYFLQFGPIDDAVVMYDHQSGRPRGFGFVTFQSEQSLARLFNHPVHAIHEKQVDIKPAVSRERMAGRTAGVLGPRVGSGLMTVGRGLQQPPFGAGVRSGYSYQTELDYMSHGLGQPGQMFSNGNQAALAGLSGLSGNNMGLEGVPLYGGGVPAFGFNGGDTQFNQNYLGAQYNFVPGMEQLAQQIDPSEMSRFDQLGLHGGEGVIHGDEGHQTEPSPLDTLASALSQQLPTTAEMTSAAGGLF